MKDAGTNFLDYQIYTAAGRTVIWDTTNAPASQTSASKNTPLSFTTFGRVPQGQDAAVAVSYTDTVTATVNF
jgi:spore coat protein U-like protein